VIELAAIERRHRVDLTEHLFHVELCFAQHRLRELDDACGSLDA
jgi:hypothetical protein